MTPAKYGQINELLSEFSSISAALEAAEGEIKKVQLAAAKELLPTHADLKVKLTDIEAKLRALSDEHYDELFPEAEKARTHNTPFGALQYRKSSSLEYKDEEKVLLKIAAVCAADRDGRFKPDVLIRTKKEPNLEALDGLDDVALALFGVERVRKDNFQIKPFDMKSDKPAKKKGDK